MTDAPDNFFGRHKGRAAVVVFVGLVISLPAFLLSNFDKLVEGKTLPQWVAENGWWSRAGMKFVVIWLLASAGLALIAYSSFAGISRLIARKRKPTLVISFHNRSPFVSDGKGNSGILYKQRRVSVTSSVQGKVSLKVPELSIGSTNYPNVHLRPIQGQADLLEPGETGYWYVVQMNSQDNSIKLVHIGNSEYNLGTQAQFEIVARCGGIVASKIVTVRIDERTDLQFQLDDIGQAPALSAFSPKTTGSLQPENTSENSKGLSGRIIRTESNRARSLDEHQFKFLAHRLTLARGRIRILVSRDDSEALDFARQLHRLLDDSGWNAEWHAVRTPIKETGIVVRLPIGTYPIGISVLETALKEIGITPEVVTATGAGPQEAVLVVGANPT